MKKLFLISYLFPPLNSAESIMVMRTVKGLAKLDWDITVLTVKESSSLDPLDKNLLPLVKDSAKIIRSVSPERFLFSLPIIRSISSRLFSYLGIPEGQYPWLFSALKTGKRLIEKNQYDIIYSRACYHTSNIVGLELKRATRLPWVAHFSDPWVDNPYWKEIQYTDRGEKKRRDNEYRLEEAIIREADAVVFVTTQTADLVMRKYPSTWKKKVKIIPHGYDKDLTQNIEYRKKKEEVFKFVYTGSFYPGLRTPVNLLKAINILTETKELVTQLHFVFIGSNCRMYKEIADDMGLGKIVEFHDQQPYMESLKVAADSDVLLLIDAPSSNSSIFLPSKLIDYLAFRKPILGLTPVKGAPADLLRRLNCPVVAPDDVTGIAKTIFELFQLWQKNSLRVHEEFDWIAAEYENDKISIILDSVLMHSITNKSTRQI